MLTDPDSPVISIITPSFNQADYLGATLSSVLNQQYPKLEYIVIDGGSSDQSPAIIEAHSEQLSYTVSEPDRGHAHAINKGFAKSSGEIMAWLNSDDMYLPWTLRVVAEIFSKFPHVQWIQGHPNHWSDSGFLIPLQRNPKNAYDYLSGDYGWIQQESVFWRRSLWEKAGGYINEDYKFMVDGELWSRFFHHARLYHVDCALSGYRLHGTNRAQENIEACKSEMTAIIDTMRQEFPVDKLAAFDGMKPFGPLINHGKKRKMRWGKKLSRTFPQRFSAASYPLLSYVNGQWQESELAYGNR